jgi:hypothetical protein
VTIPDAETLATAGVDDCQVAALVTSWFVPLDDFAVAVNCDEAPTAGMVPLTLSDAICDEDGAGGDCEPLLPHA